VRNAPKTARNAADGNPNRTAMTRGAARARKSSTLFAVRTAGAALDHARRRLLRVEHNCTDLIAGGAALFNVNFCSD